MHTEAPQFKRCCFCLPLRRGLLAWGYAKMIVNFFTLTYLAVIISYVANRGRRLDAGEMSIWAFIIICVLIDVSFNIVFIVGAHQKMVQLLKISYIYNLVWLALLLLGNSFQLYESISRIYRWWNYYGEYRSWIILDVLCSAGLAFGTLFVQVYLVLLVRSEMIKLRNQSLEMQFTNHLVTGEPSCTLHNNTCDDSQCTDKREAVQDCCTEEKQDTF